MLFTAKVVDERPAGKMMITLVVTGVVFTFVGMLLPALHEVVPFFISAMVLGILAMAIIYKGDLSNYKLVNDLNVFVDGMQIKQLVFPFGEISGLSFQFQSYHQVETYHNRGRRGDYSFGLGNSLSFTYRNQHFRYQFYLKSPQHYKAFVQMLEVLYEHKILFEEQNLKGKTFLMQNVNDDQLILLRRQYYRVS